jgi:hypothetical protein
MLACGGRPRCTTMPNPLLPYLACWMAASSASVVPKIETLTRLSPVSAQAPNCSVPPSLLVVQTQYRAFRPMDMRCRDPGCTHGRVKLWSRRFPLLGVSRLPGQGLGGLRHRLKDQLYRMSLRRVPIPILLRVEIAERRHDDCSCRRTYDCLFGQSLERLGVDGNFLRLVHAQLGRDGFDVH